jgi:hypothetical protein
LNGQMLSSMQAVKFHRFFNFVTKP